MSNEEIVEQIQNGIEVTLNQERLWKNNEGFVRWVIRKYIGDCCKEDLEDFMQQGFIGLISAVNGYCPEEGAKFLTYAENHIKTAVFRYNGCDTSSVHIPGYLKTRLRKLAAFKQGYREKFHMKLQAVRPEHIQRIINKMKREGYSRGYIENTRQTMNMIFHQAHMNGIIITNPVEKSILPKMEDKGENPHRRALTEQEQKTFLECAAKRKPFYADIFYVGFSTGMRVGEINGLEWQDIDFDKLEIHVNGTMIKVAGKDYYKGPVKTGESKRIIPLLPEIAKRLRKHKIEQAKLRLMLGDKWEPVKGLENLVFTTMFGKPLILGVCFFGKTNECAALHSKWNIKRIRKSLGILYFPGTCACCHGAGNTERSLPHG